MKPQNYSLKFQNSLADNRITPGSQHGKRPAAKAPKAHNGYRALRKLTKYQRGLAQSKVGKTLRPAKPKPQNSDRGAIEGKQMAQDSPTQQPVKKVLLTKHPIKKDGSACEATSNDTAMHLLLIAKQNLELKEHCK